MPTPPSICLLPPAYIACVQKTIAQDLVSPLGVKEDVATAEICLTLTQIKQQQQQQQQQQQKEAHEEAEDGDEMPSLSDVAAV